MITTLTDADEIHPAALATVKLYVPGESPVTVKFVPVPVIFPGFMTHVPEDGKPSNTTLPVDTVQVGCVIVPTIGADGVVG